MSFSHRDLRGIFLPITTPFDSAGNLDLPGLRANISKLSLTGINGYVMLGSTGERVHLDESEYLEVIKAAREEVSKSQDELTFIVGAGQQSTHATIAEMKRVAAAVDPDAFLVITPHFYRTSITPEALLDHYRRVADESPAPVILYSMPVFTGIKIEPETAARLSEHENIIGIKDSSADLAGLQKTIELAGKEFAVLTGNGTILAGALTAGASGGILAVGCVAPELCTEIFDAVNAGKTESAVELQNLLTPLATAVTTRFGIGGLKAALDMRGYIGGAVRAPLRAPNAEVLEEIRRCLNGAKVESVELNQRLLVQNEHHA